MAPIAAEPWTSPSPAAAGHQLIQIPPTLLSALASADLEHSQSLDPRITPYVVSPECTGTWKMREAQLQRSPEDAIWVTRLLVFTDPTAADGETRVVGRAGFHGRPDNEGRGMVEVGYSIDPACRRQGHARAALRIMVDAARADARVKVVRASVAPGNEASRRLVVEGFGFVKTGEQWDEEDGLEVVYELDLDK